uniref:Kazrin isoform X2 n=1 Tax=Petromyzon marinus TaxID=7757 RepID=A0AAJ7TUX3_PETMA|nr:kazrin isoform X2 [Petromyzon marinus]
MSAQYSGLQALPGGDLGDGARLRGAASSASVSRREVRDGGGGGGDRGQMCDRSPLAREVYLQKEVERLRVEIARSEEVNRLLLAELEDCRGVVPPCEQYPPPRGGGSPVEPVALALPGTQLVVQLTQKENELARAKEALQAMKADRRRLREEKGDLVSQMKQLYSTLDEKEDQLRTFIRNYELHRKENEEATRALIVERESSDREKWEILRRARETTDRSLALRAQLDARDNRIKELEAELTMFLHNGSRASATNARQSLVAASRDSSKRQSLVTSSDSGDSPEWPLPHETVTAAIRKSLQNSTQHVAAAAQSGHYPQHPATTAQGASTMDRKGMVSVGHSRRSSLVSEITTSSDGVRPVTASDHSSPARLPHSLANSLEELNGLGPGRDKEKKRLSTFSMILGKGRSRKSEPYHHEVMTPQSSPAHGLLPLAHPEAVLLPPCTGTLPGALGGASAGDPVTKLQQAEAARVTAMSRWKSDTILAWLELNMSMPMYGKHCRENIKSGKVLLGLSDEELEKALGVANPLHKRKLRLAIEDYRQAEQDSSRCCLSRASELDHHWVAKTWLRDVGLPQYAQVFHSQLVDGRVLGSLGRKELEKLLGVTSKFHQTSILHAIELLRSVAFDREELSRRRQLCEVRDVDTVVWTNQRVMQWVRNVDLKEFSEHLVSSGVHGALLVLEGSFTAEGLAAMLKIPHNNAFLRRHLASELAVIVDPSSKLPKPTFRMLPWGSALARSTTRRRACDAGAHHSARDTTEGEDSSLEARCPPATGHCSGRLQSEFFILNGHT